MRLFSARASAPRAGAMREIAERIASQTPEMFCVHDIDAGDALALATRFDCGWAYRGGQALFWRPLFRARDVRDRYLPAPSSRPFERRGLLEVDGTVMDRPYTLVATAFSPDRAHVRERRFVRTVLRALTGEIALFAAGLDPNARIAFADLGFHRMQAHDGMAIFVRYGEPKEPTV